MGSVHSGSAPLGLRSGALPLFPARSGELVASACPNRDRMRQSQTDGMQLPLSLRPLLIPILQAPEPDGFIDARRCQDLAIGREGNCCERACAFGAFEGL